MRLPAGLRGLIPKRGHHVPDLRSFNLARAEAAIFVAAGVCGFVVLAFPHPALVNDLAAIPLALVAIATGVALYLGARGAPGWVLLVSPALGTVIVSGIVALSGSAISAYTLYYLWIAFFCFYLLRRTEALAHLVFILINFGVVVATVGVPSGPLPNADVSYLVLATATMASATALMLYLRARVTGLAGELSGAARADPLTGLANRPAFREALDAEIERSRPDGRPASVLALDVDRLQALNDALGHDGADRILVTLAKLLRDSIRPRDTLARIGPGSFGILMPEVDHDAAYATAEDLLAVIRRGLRAPRAPVTVSCGVASYPKRAVDADGLLRAADRAMFTAKILGRDRVVVSSPEIEELLRGSKRRRTGDSLTQLKTLLSLAEALDQRDPRMAGHAESVGWYAERISRELGLTEPRTARVRLAGILHDIGKVGVPDSILFKDGPLDESEWEQMKRHPEIGARLLGSSELADIREWILHCHERPDGRGYPRGLSGEEISIEARIVCVADAYEAMTTDRAYRPAIGEEAARAELRRGAGTKYDAEAVEALIAVLERGEVPAHL